MPKPFLTYEEQVEKLVSKGLAISDVDEAKAALRDIGYFSLVNGYKGPLQDSNTRKYRSGSLFADLIKIYRFDDRLREIALHCLLVIERKLRSALSYAFCFHYGERQEAYLTPDNYACSSRYANDVARLLRILDGIANRGTDYPYIVHQRLSYGNVPLWVAVNALTFGQVSRMYSYQLPSVKAAVAKQFELVNERQLEQMLSICVLFRNACAHGERLFDHRVRVDVPDMPIHAGLCLPKKGNQYQYGKRDLFGLVITLRYLLPRGEFDGFIDELGRLISDFSEGSGVVCEEEMLQLMGFPFNWHDVVCCGAQ